MTRRNRLSLFFLATLLVIRPSWHLSYADGGKVVGNGGGSILCFSIPLAQALNNGELTDSGAGKIIEAHTDDGYAALHSGRAGPGVFLLKSGTADELRDYIFTLLQKSPELFDWVAFAYERMRWQSSPDTLSPINDFIPPHALPPNCARVQAAIRNDLDVRYDPRIWDALGRQDQGAEQALLELHEALFHVALGIAGWDSSFTERLLTSLLEEEPSETELSDYLRQNHFGYCYTTATESHRVFLNLETLYQSANRDMENLAQSTGESIRNDEKTDPLRQTKNQRWAADLSAIRATVTELLQNPARPVAGWSIPESDWRTMQEAWLMEFAVILDNVVNPTLPPREFLSVLQNNADAGKKFWAYTAKYEAATAPESLQMMQPLRTQAAAPEPPLGLSPALSNFMKQ